MGVSTTHHQEAHYVYNSWYLLFFLDGCLLSWVGSNPRGTTDQLLYTYGMPPDDGRWIHPKPVEVFDEIYLR
jgi:hypothetical protein